MPQKEVKTIQNISKDVTEIERDINRNNSTIISHDFEESRHAKLTKYFKDFLTKCDYQDAEGGTHSDAKAVRKILLDLHPDQSEIKDAQLLFCKIRPPMKNAHGQLKEELEPLKDGSLLEKVCEEIREKSTEINDELDQYQSLRRLSNLYTEEVEKDFQEDTVLSPVIDMCIEIELSEKTLKSITTLAISENPFIADEDKSKFFKDIVSTIKECCQERWDIAEKKAKCLVEDSIAEIVEQLSEIYESQDPYEVLGFDKKTIDIVTKKSFPNIDNLSREHFVTMSANDEVEKVNKASYLMANSPQDEDINGSHSKTILIILGANERIMELVDDFIDSPNPTINNDQKVDFIGEVFDKLYEAKKQQISTSIEKINTQEKRDALEQEKKQPQQDIEQEDTQEKRDALEQEKKQPQQDIEEEDTHYHRNKHAPKPKTFKTTKEFVEYFTL